jgi:hypothetical protein
VSALISKRAEVAGLIARTEGQLGQFRADLIHLDATLRLFAPELEPKTIPAKRIRQADLWWLLWCYLLISVNIAVCDIRSPHHGQRGV